MVIFQAKIALYLCKNVLEVQVVVDRIEIAVQFDAMIDKVDVVEAVH